MRVPKIVQTFLGAGDCKDIRVLANGRHHAAALDDFVTFLKTGKGKKDMWWFRKVCNWLPGPIRRGWGNVLHFLNYKAPGFSRLSGGMKTWLAFDVTFGLIGTAMATAKGAVNTEGGLFSKIFGGINAGIRRFFKNAASLATSVGVAVGLPMLLGFRGAALLSPAACMIGAGALMIPGLLSLFSPGFSKFDIVGQADKFFDKVFGTYEAEHNGRSEMEDQMMAYAQQMGGMQGAVAQQGAAMGQYAGYQQQAMMEQYQAALKQQELMDLLSKPIPTPYIPEGSGNPFQS